MAKLSVHLKGIAGAVKGRDFTIAQGIETVIGRSHECDIVVKPNGNTDKPKGREATLEHLKTVSRKHVTLRVDRPDRVFIKDISHHGTFVDGIRIEGEDTILSLETAPVELRLGTNETFRMELVRITDESSPRISVRSRELGTRD